jgi:hypothetical protein
MRHALSWKLAVCLSVLQFGSIANAGIIFDVDANTGASVNPGTSGTVTGFLDVTAPDVGAQANGWNVTMQVNFGGGASAGNVTLGTATAPAGGVFGPVFTTTGAPTYQLSGFVLFAPFPTLSARTPLFEIPFTVTGSAPAGGTIAFDIVSMTSISFNGNPLPGTFSQAPEFSLTVVPEPSAVFAAAAVLVIGGVVGYRRRKLRSSADPAQS